MDGLIQTLVGFPRLVRIGIVTFFTLMLALLVSPLIDHIYLRYLFTADTTMLPAIVTVAVASITYIIGWRIYIGTVNHIPPAEKRVLWYFVVGGIVTLIVIILLIQGVEFAR